MKKHYSMRVSNITIAEKEGAISDPFSTSMTLCASIIDDINAAVTNDELDDDARECLLDRVHNDLCSVVFLINDVCDQLVNKSCQLSTKCICYLNSARHIVEKCIELALYNDNLSCLSTPQKIGMKLKTAIQLLKSTFVQLVHFSARKTTDAPTSITV